MDHPDPSPNSELRPPGAAVRCTSFDAARGARNVLYAALALALIAHLIGSGRSRHPVPPGEDHPTAPMEISEHPQAHIAPPSTLDESPPEPLPEPLGPEELVPPTPDSVPATPSTAQVLPVQAARPADAAATSTSTQNAETPADLVTAETSTGEAALPERDATPLPDPRTTTENGEIRAADVSTTADPGSVDSAAHIELAPATPGAPSDAVRTIRLRFVDELSRARSLGDIVCESNAGLLERTSAGVCVVTAARFSGYVVDAFKLEQCGQYEGLMCGQALVDPVASQIRAAARELADGESRSGTIRLVNNTPTIAWDRTEGTP